MWRLEQSASAWKLILNSGCTRFQAPLIEFGLWQHLRRSHFGRASFKPSHPTACYPPPHGQVLGTEVSVMSTAATALFKSSSQITLPRYNLQTHMCSCHIFVREAWLLMVVLGSCFSLYLQQPARPHTSSQNATGLRDSLVG